MIDYKLIKEFYNIFNSDLCGEAITKFEIDPDKIPDIIYNNDGKLIKKATSLYISSLSIWKELDSKIFECFNNCFTDYALKLKKINCYLPLYTTYEIKDSGYVIERYKISDGEEEAGLHEWHSDFYIDDTGTRILTFILFLNNVNDGGCLEFKDGNIIKPGLGKMIIFPSVWNISYRINKPISNDLYICRGYLCIKPKDENESQD